MFFYILDKFVNKLLKITLLHFDSRVFHIENKLDHFKEQLIELLK